MLTIRKLVLLCTRDHSVHARETRLRNECFGIPAMRSIDLLIKSDFADEVSGECDGHRGSGRGRLHDLKLILPTNPSLPWRTYCIVGASIFSLLTFQANSIWSYQLILFIYYKFLHGVRGGTAHGDLTRTTLPSAHCCLFAHISIVNKRPS